MPKLIAYGSIPPDEWLSLRMPLVVCICDAFCGKFGTKMDSDTIDASNTWHSPVENFRRKSSTVWLFSVSNLSSECKYLINEYNWHLQEEPQPSVLVWLIVYRQICAIVCRIPCNATR